jgi:Predicted hydrolases or acyltransferases (alpha/beta hydrolase superfamily)
MCITIVGILTLLIITACVIIPPGGGKTKPFCDEGGNVIEGSISEKIFVEINGISLGMFIKAKDNSKPLLLFLGGGPGIPTYFLESRYPTGLEDEFVVCYPEYRGTSLSYSNDVARETMSTKQYVSDVVEVTRYLLNRFGQKKAYLLGHSFGTYIGLLTAEQYPEMFYAYIAMSQDTNQYISEIIAYDYMLEQYQAADNTKMVDKFAEYQIKTSEEAYNSYFCSSLRDTAMHDLGVGTMRDMNSVITGIFLPSLRCSAYTPAERINIWRGKSFAQDTDVVADSRSFNAFETIPEIKIPIYIFAGIYDYTCCYSLQKEYYEKIEAPVKGFYSFYNSAHSPLFEEPEKALEIFVTDIISGATTMAD